MDGREFNMANDHDHSFKAAKRRLDTCPRGTNSYSAKVEAEDSYDTAVEGVNAFRHPMADQTIIDMLMSHGIPLPHAYTYVKLLWMANINLDFPVTIANLAKQTNRTRQTVREQIVALERRGIVEREYRANGPMIWRFRTWEDLEQHLSGASTKLVDPKLHEPERLGVVSGVAVRS